MVYGKCFFCDKEGEMTRFHKIADSLHGNWTGELACENCRIEHNIYEQMSIHLVKKHGSPQIINTKIGQYPVSFIASTCEANISFPMPSGDIISINAALMDSFDRSDFPTSCSTGGSTMIITGSPSAKLYCSTAISGSVVN